MGALNSTVATSRKTVITWAMVEKYVSSAALV
ncbi:hypothetical protein EV652_10373 [Kribbella steppae]|uniref:Uncharacterized protein n=1 Tax=Kribbella steppae TaxID=2512223 RepID=A0A4R2HPI0_9ACTN|nr:hypothetical protein EV652_10373 [Kribbella steppae]